MGEKIKAAGRVFEAARVVVFLLALIALLGAFLLMYVATGGDDVAGFFRVLFG